MAPLLSPPVCTQQGAPSPAAASGEHPVSMPPPQGRSSPHAVQVGEVHGGEQLTEDSVTDPAEEGKGPPEAGEEPQLKHADIVTPVSRGRGSVLVSVGSAGYLPSPVAPQLVFHSSPWHWRLTEHSHRCKYHRYTRAHTTLFPTSPGPDSRCREPTVLTGYPDV